jgi:hypothetical protein
MWNGEQREYEKKMHGEIHELVALGLIAAICQFGTGWDAAPRVMLGWAIWSLVSAFYYAYKVA